MRIQLKMGELQASHMTMFTVIAEVVSSAFGGKKDTPPHKKPITEDLTKLDSSQYAMRFNQLMSGSF